MIRNWGERLLAALIAMSVASSVHALAPGDGVEGPDGAMVTRDSYPTEFVYRPLVFPKGLIFAQIELTELPQDPQRPYLSIEAAYGIGHGFEIGVLTDIADSPFQGTQQVEVFARYLIRKDMALHVYGYEFVPFELFGLWVTYVGVGLPLKFALPHLPVAIGGLDNLFQGDVYISQSTVVNGKTTETLSVETTTYVLIPVWVEYCPFPLLSFKAGATASIITSDTFKRVLGDSAAASAAILAPGATAMNVYGEVALTTRHIEVSLTYVDKLWLMGPVTPYPWVALAASVFF